MADEKDPIESIHNFISPQQKRVIKGRHVWGGTGNDRLEGGPGDDRIYAGRGDDTVLFTWNSGHDVFFGESGFNTLQLYGEGMARDHFKVEVRSGTLTEETDHISLTPGSIALVTLSDGSSIELHEVGRIIWGINK